MTSPGLEEFDLGPSAQPGVPPPGQWPASSRRAAGCGLGCLGLVLLQALLIWAAMWLPFMAPEGVDISLKAPEHVTVGQTFPLTITVRNRGDQPIQVMNIVVDRQTTAQLTLSNPQPAPRSAQGAGEGQIWTYAQEVAPGKSWTVRFDASARGAGMLKGMIMVQAPLVPKSVPYKIEAVMPPPKKK